MTPRDCEDIARRAELAAKQAGGRLALFAVTFGGSSELAQRADAEQRAAIHAAQVWRTVATMHPQTRARVLRDRALPSSIFGY